MNHILLLILGILDPPLGKVRLNIVKLISESIPQKLKSFFTALKETDIINTIIQLFFVSKRHLKDHKVLPKLKLKLTNSEI